jgi:hypothetical protein
MRTQADLAALKNNWMSDACWDIEDTEGFEDHREELLEFRLKIEGEWAAEHQRKLEDKAISIGYPGNTALAKYVTGLERKIWLLGHELRTLRDQVGE